MSLAAALSPESFEARYTGGQDPWSFAHDPYELGRYRTILSALERAPYETIYEPGCSIGVLTEQLAAVAHCVIASDFAPSAIAQAKIRCAGCANVEFACADVRAYVPPRAVDLIVFSEIGYYLSESELATLAGRLFEMLAPGGELVAAHWLGSSADHVLHANRVHDILRNCAGWRPVLREIYPGFRLDSWIKP